MYGIVHADMNDGKGCRASRRTTIPTARHKETNNGRDDHSDSSRDGSGYGGHRAARSDPESAAASRGPRLSPHAGRTRAGRTADRRTRRTSGVVAVQETGDCQTGGTNGTGGVSN